MMNMFVPFGFRLSSDVNLPTLFYSRQYFTMSGESVPVPHIGASLEVNTIFQTPDPAFFNSIERTGN